MEKFIELLLFAIFFGLMFTFGRYLAKWQKWKIEFYRDNSLFYYTKVNKEAFFHDFLKASAWIFLVKFVIDVIIFTYTYIL